MSRLVCAGALLTCSCGTVPSSLVVLPTKRIQASYRPAATIMDHKAFINILPFTLCTSMINPAVAAAFASTGVKVAPCTPVTLLPWIVGALPSIFLGGVPALNDTSQLICAYAGIIKPSFAGQITVSIP